MRYSPRTIEPKWQKRWLKEKIYEPDLKRAKRPFYNLMMFPYPSAEGLHVGNMYAFTGADIYGRFKRMQGYDVFEPIGLDGFGIHSENYALKTGKHPVEHAKQSEKNFYRQLGIIGNGFAWRERLETYAPDYYRWTQWIFVEMFKRGLAYRKKASVNWCPSCKTVLADEQVVSGECERCGTKVIKKDLEQWFFKITEYADRLLKNLGTLDWSENVKIAQRSWIGRSEGALVTFKIPACADASAGRQNSKFKIEVFTTRPDTLFGATYMVLAPEHPLLSNMESWVANYREVKSYIERAKTKKDEDRIAEGREKTGVPLKGVFAVNPANREEIPVWVADYVLGHVGTGAIMAVPAHDERDFAFAKKFKLPIQPVVSPDGKMRPIPTAYTGLGTLVNSGRFSGMASDRAKKEITAAHGLPKVQYRLRDWLISRQRYWGPPIPMIFCAECAKAGRGLHAHMPGWYPVPEKKLPVKLPFVKDFRPTGTARSPLASVEQFYQVRCPACRAVARRETDVSDSFLDSAWYFLRYPSVRNRKRAWDPVVTKKWLPVHSYIGGAEHSVLHLLYSRFLTMAFFDWKQVHFEEPFVKFRAHGLLIKDGAKMSKSKGNVVNPDEYIRAYGADALRMYLMFLGPFERGGDFRDTGVRGITRFLERVWRFGVQAEWPANSSPATEVNLGETAAKVGRDVEALRYNTAISALMILINVFEKPENAPTRDQFKSFLKLLAPFAPHVSEELWRALGGQKSIHRESWPVFRKKQSAAEFFLVIQVNGKVRDRILVGKKVSEAGVRARVLAQPKIRALLDGKTVKRFVYVPGKIANIVL